MLKSAAFKPIVWTTLEIDCDDGSSLRFRVSNRGRVHYYVGETYGYTEINHGFLTKNKNTKRTHNLEINGVKVNIKELLEAAEVELS